MRSSALGLALLAPLALAACVEDPTLGTGDQPVIGGTRTPDGMYPAVGALVYDFGGQTLAGCTGTLITPQVVLTAAHCLDPQVTGGILPTGFTLKHDTTTSTMPMTGVMSTMRHESFDINSGGSGLSQFFDIGLVFLTAPVTGVNPVRMPTPDEATALTVGTELELVGYGQTSDANPNSTGVMFNAVTHAIELVPTEMRVSMGTPDPQNCHGDSGGPALAVLGGGQRIVGIVSRSYESAQCDNGGVDTRVDAYLTWIHSKVTTGIPCGSGLAPACMEGEDGGDDSGCCSTGAPGGSSLLLGAAASAFLLRRRRRA